MQTDHPLDDPNSREASLSLRAEIRHQFYEDAEAEEGYVLDLFFKIFGEWTDGGGEVFHEVEAGEAHLRLVRVSTAADDEVCFTTLFDLDQTMSSLGTLYDWKAESWDFVRPVLEACPEINSFSDLFVVENLALQPWARRQGVGLRVVQLLLKNWGSGCSLAVIRPFPLQAAGESATQGGFEKYDLGSLPEDAEASTKKLNRYFRKLGFKALPACPYLVRSLELRSPSVANLDLAECLMVPSGIAKKVEAAPGE